MGSWAGWRKPAGRLVLPESVRQELERSLLLALPNEGCGLLGGRAEPDGAMIALRYVPGANIDASPLRYTMNPAHVAAALDEFELDGLRLVAIVHSHPDGPATPSPTDVRECFYPDALMLIADLSDERATLRAWRVDPVLRRSAEIAVETTPEGAGGGRARDLKGT